MSSEIWGVTSIKQEQNSVKVDNHRIKKSSWKFIYIHICIYILCVYYWYTKYNRRFENYNLGNLQEYRTDKRLQTWEKEKVMEAIWTVSPVFD